MTWFGLSCLGKTHCLSGSSPRGFVVFVCSEKQIYVIYHVLLLCPILVLLRCTPSCCISLEANAGAHCLVSRIARRTCRPAMSYFVPLVGLVYRCPSSRGLSILEAPSRLRRPSFILSGLRILRQILIEFVVHLRTMSLKKPSRCSTREPKLVSNVNTIISLSSNSIVIVVPMPFLMWLTLHR